MKQCVVAVFVLLGFASFNTNAALISYTGAGNVGLVYSSVSDITWTQDANLFKTLYDADNTLIDQIAAFTPINFDTSKGRMSWWGGIAFTNYLNIINYGGSNQWRLPSSGGSNPHHGYNTTGSELGQLYYSELGALAYPGTNGSDFGILGDGSFGTSGSAGPFVNIQTDSYWSGTQWSPNHPIDAWHFNTGSGMQWTSNKSIQLYAWAVSPGQVAAVPEPGAVWLIVSGLLGLFSLKLRRHAG